MIHRLGRPDRLVLVSVWTACDSFLIRRPIWTSFAECEAGAQVLLEAVIEYDRKFAS